MQSPQLAIIAVVIFVLLIVVGGVVFLLALKRDTEKKLVEGGGASAAPATTQAFLPFKDIVDSMIVLDNHEYRMLVDCSSINYSLKTQDEQNATEMSFRRFLNSIKFPFAFYIQTREIDNKEMINRLGRDVEVVLKSFPQLREYAGIYTHELRGINNTLQNNKFKKKYIIVTYDEVSKMTHLNDKEKQEYAFEELYNRCKIVVSGLANLGIKARVLNTGEVADVVYQSLHKEVGGIPEEIKDGSYLSLAVKGNTFVTDSPLAKIDSIIIDFENRLKTEIVNDTTVDTRYKSVASSLIENAEKMRNSAGAYFRKQKESDYYD